MSFKTLAHIKIKIITFLIILFGFSNLFANTKIPSQIDLIITGSQYKDLLKQYVILEVMLN